MTIASILLEGGGTLLVLFGIREVFRDIFHPTASGSLSDVVGRIASRLMQHTRLRPAVGPLSLVTVIVCWVILLATGFALIYCGILPREIAGSDGGGHGFPENFVRSLYFSLGAFDTFQTFNLAPQTNWPRLVISIEGLIGISMITASVSWLVLLYPALTRSRLFARRVSSLIEAGRRAHYDLVEELGAPFLMDLAKDVLQFRLDVILFPILLNFYSSNETSTVANVLPELHQIASQALAEGTTYSVEIAGRWLQVALEDLSEVLARRVLGIADREVPRVFAAYQERER
ncbi:MAG TPA: hypothetical protein VF126_11245 [Acidobacteriaceae bacterium]